jgi:hypothetical protein
MSFPETLLHSASQIQRNLYPHHGHTSGLEVTEACVDGVTSGGTCETKGISRDREHLQQEGLAIRATEEWFIGGCGLI